MKTYSIRYSVYPYNVEIHVLGFFFLFHFWYCFFDSFLFSLSLFVFGTPVSLPLALLGWLSHFTCFSLLLPVVSPPWWQRLTVAFLGWLRVVTFPSALFLPLLLPVSLFRFVCLGPLCGRLSSDACRSWIPYTWRRPKGLFIRWAVLSQWGRPGVRVHSSFLLSAPHLTSKSRKLFESSVRKT